MSKFFMKIRAFAKGALRWARDRAAILSTLAAVIILAWTGLKIYSVKNLTQEAKIQATLMVLLIIITGFYAVQTQRLVTEQKRALEEERKRRNAEFGMSRIKDFLRPLLERLKYLKDTISQIAESRHPLVEKRFIDSHLVFHACLNTIDDLFSEYLFMADPILRYGILSLIKDSRRLVPIKPKGWDIDWKDEIERDIGELVDAVNSEISKICQNIRKVYGFFSHAQENRESKDDLAFLSDRPPTRI